MRNYQFVALLGWEADCLALAPGLVAWFFTMWVYLNNDKPLYVPKRLRANRYATRLRAIFAQYALLVLQRLGTAITSMRTTRK